MHSATICSTGPSSAKLDGPVSETELSKNSRNSNESSEMIKVNPDD
jgi:hypothetical protein